MTGTNCDLFTHKSSRSYLNHLVCGFEIWYPHIKGLRFEKRAVRKILAYQMEEVKGGWRKLHNEELHSFRSLSYNSVASSKASSPHSAIQCFHFQFPLSSRFLNVVQQRLTSTSFFPVTSIPPSVSPLITFQKAVPTRDVTNQVSVLSFYCT